MSNEYIKMIEERLLEMREKEAKKLSPAQKKHLDKDDDGDIDSKDFEMLRKKKSESAEKMTPCPKCEGSMENHDPECPSHPDNKGGDSKEEGCGDYSKKMKKEEMSVKEAYSIYLDEMSQIEESNLGHLAAKHFQHYSNSNSESGHRNPERASQAAAQTLNRIKSVHGASAAAAVKQHSADADNHDNGTVSSGKKGFHKDFVSKHLGGSGSEEHKAYKSHMNKMGYTKKNLGMQTHHESVEQIDEVNVNGLSPEESAKKKARDAHMKGNVKWGDKDSKKVKQEEVEQVDEKLERDGPAKQSQAKFDKKFGAHVRATLDDKGKTNAYLKKKRDQKDAQMKKNDPGQQKSMPNYTSNFVDKDKAVKKAGKRGLKPTPYDTMSGQKPNKMQKLQRGMKEEVVSEQWGFGEVVETTENGLNVYFEHGVEFNIPAEELTFVQESADRAKHYKGATKPETMLDKYKGAGAKKMAADNSVGSPKEAEITPEEEGHKDAVKAGKVTKQAPTRGGEPRKGDLKIVNPVKENYRTLATKGMGAETKKSINVGRQVDYFHPSNGDKKQGTITKIHATGYHVKDDNDGKTHKFDFHDRAKAKGLL
jgi:hypothetical protein